eukprot:158304-Prymnesium_polylepis.1
MAGGGGTSAGRVPRPSSMGQSRASSKRNATLNATVSIVNWTLVPKSPNAITFDTRRYVTLPCENKSLTSTRAAYCVAAQPVTRGLAWRFAVTNVGHAAQHLFKCWSFFMDHESSERFIYDRMAPTWAIDSHAFKRNTFARLMVESMGARVVLSYNRSLLPRSCAVQWLVPSRSFFPGS